MEMYDGKKLLAIQIIVLIFFGFIGYKIAVENDSTLLDSGEIEVTDSNGVTHFFDESPNSVVITNTYAATVMRMLEVNFSVISGVSGDFIDSELWPELQDTNVIQHSAHSEIDFEALFDVQPDVYIVFATNGMVDTDMIRNKLEPVGINVIALDFYKYDSLRTEMSVLATLFQKQDKLTEIFAEFDELEELVKTRVENISDDQKPKVVMEHHASLTRDPVVLTASSQWNDIISMAGGKNVFENLMGHTTHVDMEAIIDSNPDFLMFDGITFEIGFDNYDPNDQCESHFGFIEERAGFDEITAIKEEQMVVMAGEFAGPMMIHGLPTLAKSFHPDLFEDIDTNQILDDYFTDYHGINRIGKFVCVA
tara:strand:+ start:1160 stop:2254 length:1095 start_codon:yes stop_codon:yes gene_type:complete